MQVGSDCWECLVSKGSIGLLLVLCPTHLLLRTQHSLKKCRWAISSWFLWVEPPFGLLLGYGKKGLYGFPHSRILCLINSPLQIWQKPAINWSLFFSTIQIFADLVRVKGTSIFLEFREVVQVKFARTSVSPGFCCRTTEHVSYLGQMPRHNIKWCLL